MKTNFCFLEKSGADPFFKRLSLGCCIGNILEGTSVGSRRLSRGPSSPGEAGMAGTRNGHSILGTGWAQHIRDGLREPECGRPKGT